MTLKLLSTEIILKFGLKNLKKHAIDSFER
nr:hypothetical protein [Mucilaginibacter sp. X4EP1]